MFIYTSRMRFQKGAGIIHAGTDLRDAAGKDGVVRHIFTGINPAGCVLSDFKQSTPEELAHDFLWRVHPHVPAKGSVAIFNRSHYEDVLVVPVHELPPES